MGQVVKGRRYLQPAGSPMARRRPRRADDGALRRGPHGTQRRQSAGERRHRSSPAAERFGSGRASAPDGGLSAPTASQARRAQPERRSRSSSSRGAWNYTATVRIVTKPATWGYIGRADGEHWPGFVDVPVRVHVQANSKPPSMINPAWQIEQVASTFRPPGLQACSPGQRLSYPAPRWRSTLPTAPRTAANSLSRPM